MQCRKNTVLISFSTSNKKTTRDILLCNYRSLENYLSSFQNIHLIMIFMKIYMNANIIKKLTLLGRKIFVNGCMTSKVT